MTSNVPFNGQKRRIPALDGIRGVAISLVVLYHSLFFFAAFPAGSSAARGFAIMRLWWNGVDLFFVLSGLLIGGILLDNRESPSYYKTFYVRRAYRILPVYFVVLALYAGFSSRLPAFGEPLPLWSYTVMLQNCFTAFTGSYGVAWLGVTWSLAVEEQFYLIAPAVIRYTSERALVKLAIAVIAISPAVRIALFYLLPHGYVAGSVLLVSRLDALVCGFALALLLRNRQAVSIAKKYRHSTAGLAAILGCILVYFTLENWTIGTIQMSAVGYTIQAVFFSLVILLALTNEWSRMTRLLSVLPLRYLGTRAFGIYLLHVPMLYLVFLIAGYSTPRVSNLPEAAVSAVAIASAIGLASLSWVMIEKPLLSRGHKSRYLAASAVSDAEPGEELVA